MRCPIESQETSETLLAYCAGTLDLETRATLEQHLEACPACRRWCAGRQAVWEALDGWEAAPVPLDFDRRLYRRIDAEAHSPWWRRLALPLSPVLVRRGLPIMAAACLLVVAGAILEGPRAPASLGVDRAGAVAVDQVERTLEDMELLQSFNQEVRAQAQTSNPM